MTWSVSWPISLCVDPALFRDGRSARRTPLLCRPLSVHEDALSAKGAMNAMTVTCTAHLTDGEGTSALEGAPEPSSAAPSRAPAGGATAPRPVGAAGGAPAAGFTAVEACLAKGRSPTRSAPSCPRPPRLLPRSPRWSPCCRSRTTTRCSRRGSAACAARRCWRR